MAKPLAKFFSPELRSACYYRLRFLWPWLARPWVRTTLRWLGWGLLACYFAFVALVLVLRYVVLPEVPRYQTRIEAAASAALGLPVKVGHLAARWDGLNPGLVLEDVRIFDAGNNPALTLERVDGVLSWQTLWRGQLHFALLLLEHPALQLRRDGAGKIFVAGIPTAGNGDPRALQWVLDQGRIRIAGATIAWEDELRQAPPLILEDLNLELENGGRRHRFGLTALPPAALASGLDIRGDLRGNAADALEQWEGKMYSRLDYADLAAWKAWLDYPVDLPRGRGGLQIWAGREDGTWQGTADLVLKDLQLRLAENLPELDLQHLSGRVSLSQGPGQLQVTTRQLTLQTRAGLSLQPLDLVGEWRGVAGQPGRGSLTANDFDLGALAALAAYLPLDETSRKLLVRHQPQGQVRQLQMSWDAREGQWKKYSVKAAFVALGLKADGALPGARGLSGWIDASEKRGQLQLDTRASALELPAIFAEPEIPLERLLAEVNWKPQEEGLDINIERFDFSGPHASGQVSGNYRTVPDGPGVIDLQGGIRTARAAELWRFIPKAVNANVPAWLRQGLLAGTGYDARLILRGDLKHFPFRDPAQGQFLITAKAKDVTLHYADGWPAIEGLAADLSFGVGMEIKAHTGRILGTELSNVKAVMPDFDAPEAQLRVDGQVSGPTAEFLRFIEQSPVTQALDHFTEGMKAQGLGRLELSLNLPMNHIADTKIKGRYYFDDNQLTFMEGLSPASGINGRLDFTESSVEAPDLRGQFLGQPMKLAALSEAGAVSIKAQGGFTVRELRRQIDLPLFDHLAGGAPWQAEVRVRKKNADFTVTSSLQGLSSSLPVPFNKTAGEALPLRLQKSPLAGKGTPEREQISLSLGQLLTGQLIRVRQANGFVIERGSVGVGEAPRLPDKGVAVYITQERLDADRWQKLLAPAPGEGSKPDSAPLPLNVVVVQTRQLTALGHQFGEVSLRLRPEGERWRVMLTAREAAGELSWDGGGQGRLTADLKRLHLESGESGGPAAEVLDSLPAMDIKVADFSVGKRRFGRLELRSENAGGRWNLNQVVIDNPDARLTGSGTWDVRSDQRTWLDFKLDVDDTGKLLERLGYPGAIRGGTATLSGKLDWAGSPLAFDPVSLGGSLQLEAAKGQFSKVNPGAGKLLGLLSLQSVTRRLSLDFRDIVSDGFAYDRITARMKIKHGVMQTEEDLLIAGPVGKVLMRGTVDMQQETQNLLVTMQPDVGGTASMGAAMIINPVVGAAAMLAQNLMRNPLDKAFSFQYRVTGSWDEPQVEQIQAGAAATEKAP